MHYPDGHRLFIATFGIRTLRPSKDAPHFTRSYHFPKESDNYDTWRLITEYFPVRAKFTTL